MDDGTPGTTFRLLQRARAGDQSALGRALERLLPSLQRFAHHRLPGRLRNMADSLDVVQDALLAALPHLDRLEPKHKRALRLYLKTAVRNRIHSEMRRLAVRDRAIADDKTPPTPERSPDPSPFDDVATREDWLAYRRGLVTLSEADQELIVASLELGYSGEQLALMRNGSAHTARMALRRAIERLARAMDDE